MPTSRGEADNSNATLKIMLEHARTLFIYHAGQRHRSLNFYFIAIAAFVTALGFLLRSEMEPFVMAIVGTVLSVSAICVTICFRRLDERNEQLVECDALCLKALENRILSDTNLNDFHIANSWEDVSKQNTWPGKKYKTIIPNLFRIYICVLTIAGFLVSGPWLLTHLCR